MEYRTLSLDRLEVRTDPADDPGFVARIVPFGEVANVIPGGEMFTADTTFATRGDHVPLIYDHTPGRMPGARDVIGTMRSLETRSDGAYADFVFDDSDDARNAAAKLRAGSLRNVSIGFIPGESTTDDQGVTVRSSVTLDHVAVVHRGAYQSAAAVAVRTEEEDELSTENTTEEVVEERAATEPVVHAVDHALEDRMRSLEAMISGIVSGAAAVEARRPDWAHVARLTALDVMGKASEADTMELRALAQDTTTTAAGFVPDFYSSEIISIVDTARPLVAAFGTDPLGDYGMNVVYPKVTQKPLVGKQATENAEVASQQMTVGTETVAIGTFAGANAVSIQLVERSNPAFVRAFYREMAGIYAQETEQELETLIVAETTGTSVLADFAADEAATQDAFIDAAVGILKNVKRMPEGIAVSPDRWGQLAKMRDTTGRPLLLIDGPRENASGTLRLTSTNGTVLNLRVVAVPNFATTTRALMFSTIAADTLEQNPLSLQATRVSTLEVELGVYGYFGAAIKYPLGIHEFTAA